MSSDFVYTPAPSLGGKSPRNCPLREKAVNAILGVKTEKIKPEQETPKPIEPKINSGHQSIYAKYGPIAKYGVIRRSFVAC